MSSINFLAILAIAFPLLANPAKVVKISDGDTITVLTPQKEQVKVRLHGIDAPEKKQAYGNKSRQFLSNLIAGKEVEVKEKGKDIYKRTIGTIYLNGTDINTQMVASGYAWAYVKYSKDYVNLEKEARRQKLGLWRDKKPIPPWEFRKR
ncbi:thermonuclease family protein [Campylobacter sp. RM6883]|uniref:thermonuclease family protein n=1 Tax=Campylobacter californiensis TaxID=1032243 RepID=UPI0014521765|nr:thermonuclease family protein [Campylobacter sp. RM6914]MBE2985335.1 thermonuclease family protein [Campylobacter sp. RM6883]MBE2995868.1 thermonuclease family protein [Campylobacter sp. RM6913]QCD51242.1 endonuclease, thermonuclease family [Campylobacter sp. RM6914]